jgi:chromosome segregation ATPase
LEFEVSADASKFTREMDTAAKSAEKSMGDVESSIKGAEDAFGDAESAGKQLAATIQAEADSMTAEIDATKRAVEAMDAALEGTDFDSREVVAELKQAGLTAEQVEADVDELAAAVKRVDDVKLHSAKAGFDDVGQAVGRVGEQTDRAKGAVSSFAGGATSELAGAAGAFGPMAEGAGQLVEGIAEGELGLKHLAGAAGAMGVAALAVKGITDQLAAAAELKAFRAEQVEAYDDALKDADSTLDGIIAKLTEAGGVTINLFGEGEEDITEQLAEAGVTADQFAKLIDGGSEALEAWKVQADEAGASAEALDLVTVAVNSELEALEERQRNAAASAAFFAAETVNLTGKFDRSAERAAALERQTDNKAQADRDASAAADDHGDSVRDLSDRYSDLKDELSDQKAYLNIQDSFDALKEKGQAAFDAAESGAEDAEAKMRDYERAQIDLTNEVLDYSENVAEIPGDVLTDIRAAIDEGNIAYVQGVMADLEKDRITNLRVRVTQEGQVVLPGGQRAMDSGGNLAAGESALVAERRPEVVNGQLFRKPAFITGPASVNSGSATDADGGHIPTAEEIGAAVAQALRGVDLTPGAMKVELVGMDAVVRGEIQRSDAQALAEFEAGAQ